MKHPSAKNAIDILTALQNKTSSDEVLAFFITPNTVLTLSGARAYCDGVFYSNDTLILNGWKTELQKAIQVLRQIINIQELKTEIDTSPRGETYVGYELLTNDGLKYSLSQTRLVTNNTSKIVNFESLTNILQKNSKLSSFNDEAIMHIAMGILLGYPDKAIVGANESWDNSDVFTEQLTSANIRWADYYTCPQPVYSYPKSLADDTSIKVHEQLWSDILTDFYSSDFHTNLLKNTLFISKIHALDLK